MIGNGNRINFQQFAHLFARFRRGTTTNNLNKKEEKLLFLFSVRFVEINILSSK